MKKLLKWILPCLFIIAVVANVFLILDRYTPRNKNICVPATLHRIFPQYSERKLEKILHTDSHGTFITNIYSAWPKLTTNELTKVYSVADLLLTNTADAHEEAPVFDKPYLWFGMVGKVGHCALVEFSTNTVTISNSPDEPGEDVETVVIDYTQFFAITLCVYDSPEMTTNIVFYEKKN